MTPPRSHRCLKGRMFTCLIVFIIVIIIFYVYRANEQSFQNVKSRQHKCLGEVESLNARLEAEKEDREQIKQAEKQALASLRSFQQREKNALKSRISVLQDQLDSLTLECNKIEKSAKDEQMMLNQYKASLAESQTRLNSVIEESKKEILYLRQQVEILQMNSRNRKQSPFNYPPSKIETKNISKQIQIRENVYNVVVEPKDKPSSDPKNYKISQAPANVQMDLKNLVTSKKTTKELDIPKHSTSISIQNSTEASAHNGKLRLIPIGFAPELLVNDEKRKNTDYNQKQDLYAGNIRENKFSNAPLNNHNSDDIIQPPNRYEAKVFHDNVNNKNMDKNIRDNKIEEALERLPPPIADKKQNFIYFPDDQDSYDRLRNNKNLLIENIVQKHKDTKHMDNPDFNDVNISLDQVEPALQNIPEEDDDENEDYDIHKANFPHQAENMN